MKPKLARINTSEMPEPSIYRNLAYPSTVCRLCHTRNPMADSKRVQDPLVDRVCTSPAHWTCCLTKWLSKQFVFKEQKENPVHLQSQLGGNRWQILHNVHQLSSALQCCQVCLHILVDVPLNGSSWCNSQSACKQPLTKPCQACMTSLMQCCTASYGFQPTFKGSLHTTAPVVHDVCRRAGCVSWQGGWTKT
jgi:hypothetical protein